MAATMSWKNRRFTRAIIYETAVVARKSNSGNVWSRRSVRGANIEPLIH